MHIVQHQKREIQPTLSDLHLVNTVMNYTFVHLQLN